MKTIRLTKKNLRRAAHIAAERMAEETAGYVTEEHEFSPEFEAKMQTLLYEANISEPEQRENHQKRRKVLPKAAAAAVALAVVLGLNTDVRAAVRGWFSHPRADDPKTVVYEFTEDYTNRKLPQITIGWLPEDFEGVEPEDTSDDYRLSLLYVSEKGRVIDIFVERMDDNNRLYIIPEENHQKIETITIKGLYSELYQDLESTTLIMFEEKNGIVIVVNATVTEAELVRIAENIEY